MNENQIDRYLLNLLTPEEKQAFEAQLKLDETLNKEMKLQQQIMSEIESLGRVELKSELQRLHQKFNLDPKKPNTSNGRLGFLLAVAALFIGILSIGWWWLQQGSSNSELYAQNFEVFELSLVQRTESDNAFQSLESLYFKGDYQQAIPLFLQELNTSKTKSSQLLIGLGICYLQIDQPSKAIEQFNTILANNDFNFEDEAQWYLALSYLKMNDAKNAKIHLNNLSSDPERDHHEAAKKLLHALNK